MTKGNYPRVREAMAAKASLRQAVEATLDDPAGDGGSGTQRDALARALVTAGLGGDTAALKLLFDRIDGPSVQKREVRHTSRMIVTPLAEPRATLLDSRLPDAQLPIVEAQDSAGAQCVDVSDDGGAEG